MNERSEHNGIKIAVILPAVLALVFAGTGCLTEKPRNGENTAMSQSQKANKATTGMESQTAANAKRLDYRQIELENGLNVITLEDFYCPIVTVQLWYHVGSKDERPDRQGFAHLFEHMMFRGTDRLGPTDHFAYIRQAGGTANGHTGFDRTVYFETLPANEIELALWLEAERMAFLKIDQQAFDTERKVVEEERRMGMNEPYGMLMEHLFAEIFKVHPYRWTPIGKIPHLRATTAQELRDFWTRYYTPSNATLIIVGAVRHEDAQRLAKKYFGWIPRYDKPPQVAVHEPDPNGQRTVVLKEDNAPAPGVGVVYRTVPISSKDSVVLDIVSSILGGGNSSRLYRELVAEKQLAVMARSESWSLEQAGLFGAGAMLAPLGAEPNSVLAIIESQIARLRTEKVSERELTKAKNQMLRELVTQNLKVEKKAEMLGVAAVDVGDVSRVNHWLDDIRAVTADDILRVANEYLVPDRELAVKVEQNMPGAIADKKNEEESAVTAEPEKTSPPPGRGGLVRSRDFPDKPPIAKLSPSRLTPPHSSRVLPNGLKVLVVPNHEVPFVSIQLGLLAGAWTEDKPGTAVMTMRMLTKGTVKHSEGELADEMETCAITLGGSGEMDTCMVNASCLTEYVGRTMGLMSEVVLQPTFPAEEFEKLRKQVLTSLAISSAEPEYLAERELKRRLYDDHPYSRMAAGEVADVNALAVDDLKQWWQKFARPDMAVLIFAGDIEEDKAIELANETFGRWTASLPQPKKELPKLEEVGQTHIYLVDKPGSVQSQIRIAQRGITRHDDGYFTSRIVSNYFGWGFESRLNRSIRVQKGLTYGVWGSYMAQRFAGEFTVGTFSKPQSTAQAVGAVLDEIKRLTNEGPSEKELENSRSNILGGFIRERETPQQTAADLWMIESQGLNDNYLDMLLSGVADTKQADCERLVRRTIEPDKMIIVVVGEADKLKDDLEKIAPVTVVPASK